jgi:beta-galactosidase
MKRLCGVAVAVLIGLAAHWAAAQDLAELEVDHALTFDFPTPHTDWAQPYALGKTRVLFLTDGHGTNPRECVELMQRFDLEAQAVFWATIVDSTESQWHGAETGERRMLGLLQQKWDCYVFLGLAPEKMSPEQQYRLLKPITEGAGVVFVGANDVRLLKDKNRLQQLPWILRDVGGEAFTVGQGRGIRLPGKPSIEYHLGWEVEYDYWQEKLGRAVLWAAGKEPKGTVEITLDKPEFAFEELGQNRSGFGWKVSGVAGGPKLRAEVRIRKAGGSPQTFEQEVGQLGRDHRQTVSGLPAGEYHADVRVLSERGVETWATAPFKISAPLRVAGVNLDQGWGEVGEKVTGEVALEGEFSGVHQLWVRLFDSRNRELKRQLLKADSTKFEFPIEPWMPMLLRVEAMVYLPDGAGAQMHSAYSYFRVTKRHQGRFNFLMWDVPRGTLAPYAEASLAKHSVTLQLTGGQPPLFVAANDIAWVPYTTRIMTPKTADGIMQPFCWNDDEAVTKHVTEKAASYLPTRQHGVFVWSLGDEVETRGCCLSPQCAAAYRKYLAEVYGDLEALNKSWGTDFKAWDEVGLSKADDNEEANSLLEKNYPRWFDRQAFKSHNFVQFCQKYARAYEAIDPKAKTGFEGAGRFEDGDDLDLIVRSNKFWSPYPGTADEVVRSLAPREFPRSNWMGYTKDADSLLQKYWRMVTRGTDAVWWWRWDCIGRFHGWLAPDLRPYPAVKEILEDTQIVRDGLGDLLLQSDMQDDGVAILFSYPSVFAHKLEEGTSYGGYEAAHLAAQQLVRELGLQFRYVSDRMLRLGEFDPTKYKVLLLPRCEALGDKEAAVIRSFAEKGGLVLADVRPGIYDDHCKPREKGVLDDLFGVTREGRAAAKVAGARIEADAPLSFEKAKVDPTVKVADGDPGGDAEGTPLAIARQAGSGRAFLLNCDFSSYPKLSVEETPEAAASNALTLLRGSGGTAPRLQIIEPGTHQRVRNLEVVRWQNGHVEIVALFRQAGLTQEAEIRLPQARYVYDLRNRKSLGEKRSFTTKILPNRASFFVLYPGAVPSAQLAMEKAIVPAGSLAKARLSVPGLAGEHAFRIRAKAEGKELEWVNQIVLVGRDGAEFDLPIAYNDPQGKWEIIATDLFTNAAAVAKLDVRGRP